MLERIEDLKNEIDEVLCLPLVDRQTDDGKREHVVVDPIKYKTLTKSLREVFADLTNAKQRVRTAVVFAKGYCPIDLDPVWNPIYPHEGRKVTLEFLPKINQSQYDAMIAIVEKELAGPDLRLSVMPLTRDIWPFAKCLDQKELLKRRIVKTPTEGFDDPPEISYWDLQDGAVIKIEMTPEGRQVFRDFLK